MSKRTVNKVILVGFLGADPVMRFTNANKPYVTMRVATTEGWKEECGAWKEDTEWHSLIAWGKMADICNNILKKGMLAYFECRIKYQKFTDKGGIERYSTSLKVSNMEVLDFGNQVKQENTAPAENSTAEDPGNPDLPF